MKHDQNAFAPEAATDEPASSANPADAEVRDLPAFAPVPLRYREDGLTPEKQREYVEALADTGIGRAAAARIGVSERSIARLRRRADAKSFDLACAAARRIGARQLHATAWERAIEGTIKGHYYHGELKSEERVYDHRLLVYLLGKTEHLLDEPPEAAAVAANWQPFVEAMEQGLPPPDLRSAWQRERDELLGAAAPEEAQDEEDGEDEGEYEDEDEGEDEGEGEGGGLESEAVWEVDGLWLTSFPPPADFDGDGIGVPGEADYRRTLTEAEEAVVVAEEKEGEKALVEAIRRGCARRDRYFGFEGGLDPELLPEAEAEAEEAAEEAEIFSPLEAGPSGRSDPPPTGEGDRAQHGGGGGAGADTAAAEPGGEPGGAAPAEAAPAAAELYEPAWLRARRRRGDADAGVPLSPE